jgi:hypothetical protein
VIAPEGTLSGKTDQTSFARYAGLLMTFSIIVLVFVMVAMLALMDICNPAVVGTEVHEVCEKRFSPSNLAAFMTAAGATFGGTTVFLYRANKQAETNGV